jgi:hypothetical protein
LDANKLQYFVVKLLDLLLIVRVIGL